MEKGFIYLENFLNEDELSKIEKILRKFHEAWLAKNKDLYEVRGAINSAYLTSGEFLDESERLDLLKLVGSEKIVSVAKKILGNRICFLNTQLFFNPYSSQQKNYWHRDIQYTRKPLDEQKQIIESKKTSVLHLRLPLVSEPGLELIPESHFRWDTANELETRLEMNGRASYDDLEGAEVVSLSKGDLLAFDANIVHRGLYGGDRLSLDILFCVQDEEFTKLIDKNVYPKEAELSEIECRDVFI